MIRQTASTASNAKWEWHQDKATSECEPILRIAPSVVVQILDEGNARYAAEKPTRPNRELLRRIVAGEQGEYPFAVVVTASDSRVIVEEIFDRGIGDLFVVTVHGGSLGDVHIGSVEFAVEELYASVIVVLGHSGLAEHRSARNDGQSDRKQTRRTFSFEDVPRTLEALDGLVRRSMDDLSRLSQPISTKIIAGEVMVVGAIYDGCTGRIQWLNHRAAGSRNH
ncbi:MAG: carbonic anhydrase [Thermodesulfobacteriota bacterium]